MEELLAFLKQFSSLSWENVGAAPQQWDLLRNLAAGLPQEAKLAPCAPSRHVSPQEVGQG